MNIVFLGFNSFKIHKRGVENVIDFQSKAVKFERIYYIHFGQEFKVYKNGQFICISLRNNYTLPIMLNLVLFRIKKKIKVIIHSHSPLLSFFLVGRTDILTVHDALYYQKKPIARQRAIIFAVIEYTVYFRCKVVHFISHFSKRQSLFGNRDKYIIISNTSHFERRSENLMLPDQDACVSTVLCVRSIEERARFDLLIETAALLENKQVNFKIAGKGPLLDYYRKQVVSRNLFNIDFLGYVEDSTLLQLYNQCNIVLVIADYAEGFGLPIIEGYLFNKPVLASNCCAMPEIIIDREFLFENDPKAISAKILAIKNHTLPQEDFRDYYHRRFSNAVISKELKALYNRSNYSD